MLFTLQVESLFEDEDFRTKVTREQFEDLCQDLVDRIDKVIKDALATAELSAVCCHSVISMRLMKNICYLLILQ